jgi:hypothetical protein
MIERTLMIMREPLAQIFGGGKTWEVRTQRTLRRGRIALSEKGAARIVGSCTLHNVNGPLSRAAMTRNAARMGMTRGQASQYWSEMKSEGRHIYAWELRSIRRFRNPVAFKNPSGAVTWAKLPARIATKLR